MISAVRGTMLLAQSHDAMISVINRADGPQVIKTERTSSVRTVSGYFSLRRGVSISGRFRCRAIGNEPISDERDLSY